MTANARNSASTRWAAKDWENRNHSALAFLRLASIRLMLRKGIVTATGAGGRG
jgi:hypothetical protein